MVLEFPTWVGLVALFLPLLSPCVAGECVILETDTILINNHKDMKDQHCHWCYQAPLSQLLQVRLQQVRLRGLSSIMIYMDGISHHISKDCGECQEGTDCQDCEEITAGRLFELYLRQNVKDLQLDEGENACKRIAFFNISLAIVNDESELEAPPDCEDGFLVSLPLSGDSCVINTTLLGTETHCLLPTCADGSLSSDGLMEKIEHKFKLTSVPETCVWQLNTEQRKHLTLTFSQNIRPHLTVFEESLMNPRWDMEWCPAYNDNYRLKTDADKIYVVYHNTNALTKKGSLSITTQTDLCLLPPSIKNGSVEFKRRESGMMAQYSCDHGYTLEGPATLKCKHGAWGKPPHCLHNKDKLMSDAPMESVESVDSANVTAFAPENDTSLTPGDISELQVKMMMNGDDAEEENVTLEPGLELDDEEEEQVRTNNEEEEEDAVTYDETHTSSYSEVEWGDSYASNDTLNRQSVNGADDDSSSSTGIFTGLLNLNLEEDMQLYIIIGGTALTALLLIIIITVVACRKRYPRLGLGRRFDTFQNPIYEKAVVRVPLQGEEPAPEG